MKQPIYIMNHLYINLLDKMEVKYFQCCYNFGVAFHKEMKNYLDFENPSLEVEMEERTYFAVGKELSYKDYLKFFARKDFDIDSYERKREG